MKMNLLFLMVIIFCLVSISFSTLFERKLISYMNLRWGPNKCFYFGILIPFADFMKLINKKFFLMYFLSFFYFFVFWGMLFFLMIFLIYPINNSLMSLEYSFLYFIIIFSLLIYMFFFMSWSSKSKYSYISSYRILIQTISYEVGFVFSFLILIFMWMNMDFFFLFNLNFMYLTNLIFMTIWIIFLMSESNRSPFDLIEGESELVSGFNIEYYSSMFSFIFMIEYGFLIFMSMLMSFFLFGMMSMWLYMLFFYFFCFIRCIFPRFRYDKMMIMFWKDMLFLLMYMYMYMSLFF